ncbi:cell division protein FtsL [Rhizobium sp. CAU 1783]
MLRTIDIVMIGAMAAAAAVTYQIKHHTDNKLEEVRRIEAEIKLEKDTIELLRADWALLTQPNRLERLTKVYAAELKLEPTAPEQLARPVELPMPKDQVPKPEVAEGEKSKDPVSDLITTGSVKP